MLISHMIVMNSCMMHIFTIVLVEGICEGVSAGPLVIDLRVGACEFGTSTSCGNNNCILGYRSSVHFLVSETFVERKIVEV